MRRLVCLGLLLALCAGAAGAREATAPAKPLRTPEQRAVVLQGTRNTRDLGGLPVLEGYVRDGRLYRSGALCFITESDVEVLKRLGIRTLLELRQDPEIQKDGPDRYAWTDTVPVRLRLPMGASRGPGAEAYASYLEDNPRAIRDFFHMLAEPGAYPVLFHCSAGKDRAGILTALVLESLGTPRQVIMDDYMQSVRNSPGLVVHPEWLQVVFAHVDACGGIGPYLQGIGVTDAQRQALRRNLVVPAPTR